MSDDPKDVGRRDTLKLATLAAALGAGLSVSLHAEDAEAGESMLAIKFYQANGKGEAELLHSVPLPDAVSKRLLESDPSQLQWKCYSAKDAVVGAGPLPLKVRR